MATVEQCLFCFETLVGTLESRPILTLTEVEEAWAEYPKGDDEETEDETDDTEDEKAACEFAGLSANAASSTPASSISSKPPSSAPSKPSTPISASTFASSSLSPASSRTPNFLAAILKPEESYTPIGQSKRSAQTRAITSSPLFVTWNKISARTHTRSLRGCIGTFEPQDLALGLRDYALTSALQDTRFNPITPKDLPLLEVAVTLLTDFEQCNSPLDWELGVRGIKISFYERHRRYSATYLPDVAVEQGWNKEETLESLVRKAGWTGRRGWREVGDLKVVRYQGRKESVEYEEFKKFREWIERRDKK